MGFVKVNGVNLFVKVLGEPSNKPAVIMDAGYGDYSKTWDLIVPDLARETQVLVYDRAGLGRSETSTNPRTSREMVKELHELLDALELKIPYILVGHSFGGVNMRLYASTYPEEICGLILIDSTPEDYVERFLPTMSDDFQKAYNSQFIHEGNYDEFIESLRQVNDLRSTLPIPLTVICAGKKSHYSKASQELWNEMQRELLSLSTEGTFVLAENSAHYVQHDEPELVLREIKGLINKSI
ncbi:alpha/beta fold hydrolase [Fictibacillus aquaticus]|uniref:Alpha/beta hydrolase n=1 Tax=Fictibacillus aquaticus TaxID=2021314 RepID=A0A235F9G6_9BACL|nr:alpha/beta hydrolase [Fictibacillus aquaticus]OYD57663.1 alpha/beta hydrolase [Fictibacillus aquaticus]